MSKPLRKSPNAPAYANTGASADRPACRRKPDAYYKFPQLAVPLERVQENFRRLGLPDDSVVFLKGWFKDTLPTAPIEKIALLRLEGDLYESTMDALVSLYPKLQRGGYCIVDDYGEIPACRQAVEDYRARHGIGETTVPIDRTGVFWRR